MKVKIKVDAATFKKLPASADICDVSIGETYKSAGAIRAELSSRSPEKLIELGQTLATISDDEVKAFEKRVADKAAAQAKKDA